jgi:hypothetical protein
MNGDRSMSVREFAVVPGIEGRVDNIVGGLWYTTQDETTTMKQAYNQVADVFGPWLGRLSKVNDQLIALENKLEKEGAPYTPGRFPVWHKE